MPVLQRPTTLPKKQRNHRLFYLSLASFCLTITLYLLAEFVGEQTWLTTLFAYAPPVIMALPVLVPLLLSLVRRNALSLVVNLAATVFVLFIVLGFALPVGPAPAPNAPQFRLMTYNIEHGQRGIAKLIAQVRSQNPDVVCFQECNGYNQYSDPYPVLKISLPEYHFTRANETVIATRLPVLQEATLPLLTPDGRVLVEMVVEVGGRPVTLLSVHLMTAASARSLTRHRGTIPAYIHLTAAARKEQVERIIRKVQTIPTPVVLCGDFNTPPRGLYYRRLTEYFTDGFATKGVGFGWTFPSSTPCLRIDYLFTRQGAQPIRVFTPLSAASDHLPVVADIALTAVPQ